MSKLIISGYGKMGKEIEKEALNKGWQILAKIDNGKQWKENEKVLAQADVIIDFSTPGTVLENIGRAFELGIPMVVGTTGWYEHLESIKKECEQRGAALVYGSNFSIGMNIFFEINKELARLMNDYEDYDVSIKEIHHTAKLDSPSGTAISLAGQIIAGLERKATFVNEATAEKGVLGIVSERIKDVPGTHIVKYQSDIDEIEIKHTAKNRRGFAKGALLAAQMIKGKKGFFEFNELLFNKV